MDITMGSLFSGFGGFEIAAQRYDVKVLWQSEIEPWAIELLKKRFPDALQLGDINNINGYDIPPVDIITFGSPCQDMSVAGVRKGMKYICSKCGEEFDIQTDAAVCPECGAEIEKTRSGLFIEAMRIIREMREATNGEYPRYIIWENVPGAFTSNRGNDFRAVLEEITESKIPIPKSGRWANAGMVRGGECDVSWRVLDAQYWGVPQRRKRIYLVGDYRTERSGEILFKPESVSRYPKQSGEARQRIAAGIKTSVGETDTEDVLSFIPSNGEKAYGIGLSKDLTPMLRAESPTAVCIPFYVIQDKIIGRKDKNTCKGDGISGDVCYTLTGFDVHGICIPIYSMNRYVTNQGKNEKFSFSIRDDGLMQTLTACGPNSVCVPVYIGTFQGQASSDAEISHSEDISPTLQCTKSCDLIYLNPENMEYIVRRLTPSECAKLQGFPADWHVGVENQKVKTLPDTAAYKGYGNAVATVCAEYPISNIVEILKGQGINGVMNNATYERTSNNPTP